MLSSETLAKELSRKYQREWRAKNKDKVKRYNQNYWQKKAEKLQKESEKVE